MRLNLSGGTATIDGSIGVLKVDGIVGPASLAEAHRQGFERWRDVATA
jgi:hypothetical protein